MLRGCLLYLGVYALTAVGYFFWLDSVWDRPGSYWAAALVALFVLFGCGAIVNARSAYRDWRLILAAQTGLPPRDGRLLAVAGTIHPVGQPLIAPFSGEPCVLCEYDLTRGRPVGSSTQQQNLGVDFTGFLMTPSVILSMAGEMRLLGFPLLEQFSPSTCHRVEAAWRAMDFLSSRTFENHSGLRFASVLSVFGDVWSDEDGFVDKNIRIGKVDLPSLFPPELEAEIDRQLQQKQSQQSTESNPDAANGDDDLPNLKGSTANRHESAEAPKDVDAKLERSTERGTDGDEVEDDEVEDDQDEEDEFDDEDDGIDEDDDAWSDSIPAMPRMKETRVEIGQAVCAVGRYDEARNGLRPAKGSATPNRLIRGTAQEFAERSRGAIASRLTGGIAVLLIVHGVTLAAIQLNQHSPSVRRSREQQAFQAAAAGDLARLELLTRRGVELGIRNDIGEPLLLVATERATVAWLLEHGADRNAADANGRTALMQAARTGRADIVKLLIDAKADLDRGSDDFDRTALIEAIDAGYHEIAEMLRKAGAKDRVVSAANGEPLPEDGGPQLAVCLAYLAAIRDRDPAGLQSRFSRSSKYDFSRVDFELWQNTRPAQIESWSGFTRDDDATIHLFGPTPRGVPTHWTYQLQRVDGEWIITREHEAALDDIRSELRRP
jgi:hypothetical protein